MASGRAEEAALAKRGGSVVLAAKQWPNMCCAHTGPWISRSRVFAWTLSQKCADSGKMDETGGSIGMFFLFLWKNGESSV